MIRPLRSDDLASVADLERLLFPDAWDVAGLADVLTPAGRRGWVAVATDSTVSTEAGVEGYVLTGLAGDFAEVLRIAVRPERRRRGVARELLAAALEAARADGADRVLLEVSATNTAATRFYAAAGFARVDVRPRYYRDGSDALVLLRPLDDGFAPSGRMDP